MKLNSFWRDTVCVYNYTAISFGSCFVHMLRVYCLQWEGEKLVRKCWNMSSVCMCVCGGGGGGVGGGYACVCVCTLVLH